MNAKRLLTITLGVVLLMGLVWWITPPTSEPESKPIRIGYLNITASLPFYIAEERGFFRDEGLQVVATSFATSNQLVDALAAGNIDLVVETSAAPLLAMAAQAPGRARIFAASAITRTEPFDGLIVPVNSSITSLSDLAGKRVGVFPGSTATKLLNSFLKAQGVDTSRIQFVPLPPSNQLAALAAASVDALHAYEPTLAFAAKSGTTRPLFGSVYAEMLDRNPQGVAVVSSKLLADHALVAQKAMKSLTRAMTFMRSDDLEARTILAKRLELPAEVAASTTLLYMYPVDASVEDALKRYVAMLHNLGEFSVPPSVPDLIYLP